MNHTFFGLTRRPFRPTPDADLYFPAPSHEAAVRELAAAYDDRDGVALIDGDPGTGKTLAVLRFLNGLPSETPTVLIPAPRFTTPAELFQAILFDLGLAYQGLSEHELRLAVADRLLGGLGAGAAPTVIVIDEAQHLGPDLLEEVRLLGNLESRTAKAAFIVLSALPALRERFLHPDVAALAQRVAVRCRIDPLTADESAAFVRHQLEVCGGDPDELLTAEAAALLAAHCRGVPRLLNQAAAAAFALAAAAEERTVDAEPVLEALARLGLAAEPVDGPTVLPAADEDAEEPVAPKARGRKRRAA